MSLYSWLSSFVGSLTAVFVSHRRITVATLTHHNEGPLVISSHSCIGTWSNTKEAAAAYLSHSVATWTLCYTECSLDFRSSGIWCCISGQLIANTLKEHSVFMFRDLKIQDKISGIWLPEREHHIPEEQNSQPCNCKNIKMCREYT